jgi:hypothetical protein
MLRLLLSTGVMAIVRGSVVALAYVEFKADTPAKEIDQATSHLRTNADRLYGASSLPSSWGGLVSYLVSPNAASLDTAVMEVVPQQQAKSGKLGSGEKPVYVLFGVHGYITGGAWLYHGGCMVISRDSQQ